MLVSIVIRTLNEQLHLAELLKGIRSQVTDGFDIESVIVDSGSTDDTLAIAERFGCRITNIDKQDFTFGRSLNVGCEFADGEILVFVSGHCIPSSDQWLLELVRPLREGVAQYTYGRQIGRDTTKFSELKIFDKYFGLISKIPQNGFFSNNANAATTKKIWSEFHFNEQVTGLEDMELTKRLCEKGGKIAYVSEAGVYHIHNESWRQTRRRYERESIALQVIMPDVHISLVDMIRYILASVVSDSRAALRERCFIKEFVGIVVFRLAQFTGTYRGNHDHRILSRKRKENYFYPNNRLKD